MSLPLTFGPSTVNGSTRLVFVVHTVTFTAVALTDVIVFVMLAVEPLTGNREALFGIVTFKPFTRVPLLDIVLPIAAFILSREEPVGKALPNTDSIAFASNVFTGPVWLLDELLSDTAGNTDSTGAACVGVDTVLLIVVVVVVHTVLFT